MFLAYGATLMSVSLAQNLMKAGMGASARPSVCRWRLRPTRSTTIPRPAWYKDSRSQEAAYQKAAENRIDHARAAAQQLIDLEAATNNKIAQMMLDGSATKRKSYYDLVDSLKDADAALATNSKDTMLKMVSGVEKQVHIFRDAASESERAIKSSVTASRDIQDKITDSALLRKDPGNGRDCQEVGRDHAGRGGIA